MTDEEYNKLSTEEKIAHKAKKNPGIANLTPMKKGTKHTQSVRKKGQEKIQENKLKREAMRQSVLAFGTNKLDPKEDLTALETMKILKNIAISNEDWDTVLDISKTLAEYEAPKKSRVEEIKSEVDFNDYAEEDVEAYINNVITIEELQARRKTG